MTPTRPADLYDRFYDLLDKDYVEETKIVRREARLATGRTPETLLDVACGTGRHIDAFSRTLECVGVDNDPDMLRVARRRCPDVRFVHGDMRDFDLGREFDLVTCLFSSIGYMRSVAQLRRAITTMAAHVAEGGALVIEPWYQPKDWDVGHVSVLTIDEPELKATRLSRSSRRGAMAVLDFDYVIAEPSSMRHYTERHELRLFTWNEYTDAFHRAGLDVTTEEYGLWGRGIFVGTRRPG